MIFHPLLQFDDLSKLAVLGFKIVEESVEGLRPRHVLRLVGQFVYHRLENDSRIYPELVCT